MMLITLYLFTSLPIFSSSKFSFRWSEVISQVLSSLLSIDHLRLITDLMILEQRLEVQTDCEISMKGKKLSHPSKNLQSFSWDWCLLKETTTLPHMQTTLEGASAPPKGLLPWRRGCQPHPPAHPQYSWPTHNRRAPEAHTGNTPRVPEPGDKGWLHCQAPREPSTKGQHLQDQATQQTHLIDRNQHRESDKMRRQKSMFLMKGQVKTSERTKWDGDRLSIW